MFGIFKNIKAPEHIKNTPVTEFDYTKKFKSGKSTIAAAVNDYLPSELTNMDPTRKNPTLAHYISGQ